MLNNYFSVDDISEFMIWMGWADHFVVTSHMSPDGDAVGSSLALCHYLKSNGKQAAVVLPDRIPDFMEWLPGAQEDIVYYSEEPGKADAMLAESDVICCLDYNTIGRVGNLAASVLYSKAKKIMIDHHPYPGDFCDIVLSHPEASSTSELIFHLICAMAGYMKMEKNVAECIYTGMMTDTGAFTYNSNNPVIFQAISLLLDKEVDKDLIYRKVYHNYSVSRLRLQGYMLSEKMMVLKDASTALITLSDKELKKFDYRKGDTEGFVNMPLQIAGIRMSVLLREDRHNGIIKVSIRSVGTVPCNRFAKDNFNGGGHVNASGGEFQGTLEEAISQFYKGMQAWAMSNEECISRLFRK